MARNSSLVCIGCGNFLQWSWQLARVMGLGMPRSLLSRGPRKSDSIPARLLSDSQLTFLFPQSIDGYRCVAVFARSACQGRSVPICGSPIRPKSYLLDSAQAPNSRVHSPARLASWSSYKSSGSAEPWDMG